MEPAQHHYGLQEAGGGGKVRAPSGSAGCKSSAPACWSPLPKISYRCLNGYWLIEHNIVRLNNASSKVLSLTEQRPNHKPSNCDLMTLIIGDVISCRPKSLFPKTFPMTAEDTCVTIVKRRQYREVSFQPNIKRRQAIQEWKENIMDPSCELG